MTDSGSGRRPQVLESHLTIVKYITKHATCMKVYVGANIKGDLARAYTKMHADFACASQLRLQLARSCRSNPITIRAVSRHIRDILFWLPVRNSDLSLFSFREQFGPGISITGGSWSATGKQPLSLSLALALSLICFWLAERNSDLASRLQRAQPCR